MKKERENPKGTVFIRSFGCPSNLADAKFMERSLKEAGYRISENTSSADFLIFNTCAVKTPTENRMISLLKKVPSSKKLVITGCLPVINFQRILEEVDFSGVSGPSTGPEILDILSSIRKGVKTTEIESKKRLEPLLPSPQSGQLISIVPIAYGCLGNCSYCCVKAARGTLRSYPVMEIVDRISIDVEKGTKEIWLTGQDLGCYGYDLGTTLPELVTRISEIEGKFRVRVGMMNPQHVLKIQDNLVSAFKSSKVFKFLHIPVQSGDDKVLGYMNRNYSVDDFRQIISKFRGEFGRITIATDVICGFPGEDGEAFENTLQLVRDVRPEVVNISKFFRRPKTPRLEGGRVSSSETKRRSRLLTDLYRDISLKQNRRWIGWEGEVLVDEVGTGKSWVGRNFAYKPVVIREREDLLGQFVNVKIRETAPTYLLGETR